MAQDTVSITQGSGTKIQTFVNTVNAVTAVECQAVSLVDATGISIGTTTNPVVATPQRDIRQSRVSIVYQGAPATTDTLVSLVRTANGVAGTAASSIGVTSGKTLRIGSILFSLKSGAAAAAFATMTFRSNPTGATVIGSQSELRIDLGNTAATIGAADHFLWLAPEGFELSGTQTLGVSVVGQATTNVISISITGFEY